MSAGFMLSRRYRLIFVTSSHKSKPNISFSIIFRPFIITHTVPWLPHGFESLWRILPSTGRNFPFVQVQSASESRRKCCPLCNSTRMDQEVLPLPLFTHRHHHSAHLSAPSHLGRGTHQLYRYPDKFPASHM